MLPSTPLASPCLFSHLRRSAPITTATTALRRAKPMRSTAHPIRIVPYRRDRRRVWRVQSLHCCPGSGPHAAHPVSAPAMALHRSSVQHARLVPLLSAGPTRKQRWRKVVTLWALPRLAGCAFQSVVRWAPSLLSHLAGCAFESVVWRGRALPCRFLR